jgi:hypothetical protein
LAVTAMVHEGLFAHKRHTRPRFGLRIGVKDRSASDTVGSDPDTWPDMSAFRKPL